MPAYETWNAERAAAIISEHAGVKGATLPIFRAMQEAFGYVADSAIPMVADAPNLSRAEVLDAGGQGLDAVPRQAVEALKQE